jgi:hypothetical protein
MELKKLYAKCKLRALIRDMGKYSAQEFSDEMSRIAQGATGIAGAEELQKEVSRLKEHAHQQGRIIISLRADLAKK